MAKSAPPPTAKPKHRSNIYTILALATILALGTGVVLLYMANVKMTGWEQQQIANDPDVFVDPLFLTNDPDKK